MTTTVVARRERYMGGEWHPVDDPIIFGPVADGSKTWRRPSLGFSLQVVDELQTLDRLSIARAILGTSFKEADTEIVSYQRISLKNGPDGLDNPMGHLPALQILSRWSFSQEIDK